MAKWTEIGVEQFCVRPEIVERSVTFFEYKKCKSLESLSMLDSLQAKRKVFLKSIFN